MAKERGRTYVLRGSVMWLIKIFHLNDNATAENLGDKLLPLRLKALNLPNSLECRIMSF